MKCKLDASYVSFMMTPGQGSIVIYKYSVDLFIKSASGSEGLEIPGHLSQVSTWCTYLVDMTCCGI